MSYWHAHCCCFFGCMWCLFLYVADAPRDPELRSSWALWRFWEELGSSERQRLWDTLLDSWYSCWIQDFHKRLSILSWLEQYHSWHTLLFHAGSLSSKPHQRIRILQSSVLSAAYPAAESPRLLSLSGQRKPIALAHQNWLYNLIQPGWFIHPGGTSS